MRTNIGSIGCDSSRSDYMILPNLVLVNKVHLVHLELINKVANLVLINNIMLIYMGPQLAKPKVRS